MTVSEFRRWVKFRNTRGSLYMPRRLELSVAKLCALITGIMGVKKSKDLDVTFSELDFTPHEDGYLTRNDEVTMDQWFANELQAQGGKKTKEKVSPTQSLD